MYPVCYIFIYDPNIHSLHLICTFLVPTKFIVDDKAIKSLYKCTKGWEHNIYDKLRSAASSLQTGVMEKINNIQNTSIKIFKGTEKFTFSCRQRSVQINKSSRAVIATILPRLNRRRKERHIKKLKHWQNNKWDVAKAPPILLDWQVSSVQWSNATSISSLQQTWSQNKLYNYNTEMNPLSLK